MGFEPKKFDITLAKDTRKDIILEQLAEGLEEVVIEMPMVVKENTIVYNVDHFATGEERKLKDVLKKLPGVEIDRNGNIKVGGKEITVMLWKTKNSLVVGLN